MLAFVVKQLFICFSLSGFVFFKLKMIKTMTNNLCLLQSSLQIYMLNFRPKQCLHRWLTKWGPACRSNEFIEELCSNKTKKFVATPEASTATFQASDLEYLWANKTLSWNKFNFKMPAQHKKPYLNVTRNCLHSTYV